VVKEDRWLRKVAADVIAFFVFALLSITASVMVMEAKDIFHAALFLGLLFASVAGIYILLTAEFIAAIQILVYAGAVVVLILFAIVLTKRDNAEEEISVKNLILKTTIIIGFVLLLIQPILRIPWPNKMVEYSKPNTYSVGFSLFTDYVIPFEIVSLALLAALIGALYLARREVPQ
jgi:NADH-quinone oxidoreductase subunit J